MPVSDSLDSAASVALGYLPGSAPAARTPHSESRSRFVAGAPSEAARRDFELLRARIVARMPLPARLAADELAAMIRARTGREVDPNHLYLHYFGNGARNNSSVSVNGWQHRSVPLESRTLVEAVLTNFNARDMEQDDDTLRAQSGIYTTSSGGSAYGPEDGNEFALTAVQLRDFVHDFYPRYKHELERFWTIHQDDVRVLAKLQFINDVRLALLRGELDPADYRALMTIATPRSSLNEALTITDMRLAIAPPSDFHVRRLDISGYASTDIRVMTGSGKVAGRIFLYVPGAAQPILRFSSDVGMRRWLRDRLPDTAFRAEMLKHFTLYDEQDGLAYSGVHTALLRIADRRWDVMSAGVVDVGPGDITSDVFGEMTSQRALKSQRDGDTLIRSSGEVLTQRWLGYLSALVTIAGAPAALDAWPLTVAGVAWASQVALHARIMETGDTPEARAAGLHGLVGDVVTAISLPVFCRLIGLPAETTWGLDEQPSRIRPRPVSPVKAPPGATAVLSAPVPSAGSRPVFGGLFHGADGAQYIRLGQRNFQVRADPTVHGWRIVNPDQPFAFYDGVPFQIDRKGRLRLGKQPGLRGGGPAMSMVKGRGRRRIAEVIRHRAATSAMVDDEYRDSFVSALGSLSSSSRAEELPYITDYVENGAAEINDVLRRGSTSSSTAEFIKEFRSLSTHRGVAYRAVRITSQGQASLLAGQGMGFRDLGVQSASTQLTNLNGWADVWAKSPAAKARSGSHPAIFIFDESVPMKNLSTGMLPDHVAIPPGTILRLSAVRQEAGTIYAYFKSAKAPLPAIFDLYDGQPLP